MAATQVDKRKEQRQAARAAFENEPKERAAARREYMKRFKKAFDKFKKQDLLRPEQRGERFRADPNAANDFQVDLNVLLSPKEMMQVLKASSANEFKHKLNADMAYIGKNLSDKGSSQSAEDYIKANPPDITHAADNQARVLHVETQFGSPGQPDRMKATHTISLRYDRMAPEHQDLIKSRLAESGVNPDAALKAMHWPASSSGKTPDDVPRLTMRVGMITSESEQFQTVQLDRFRKREAVPQFGATIEHEPTNKEMLEWSLKPDRNGELPSVRGKRFMDSYTQRAGPNAPRPRIHEVLTAPEGDFTADERSIVERQAGNGVKASKAGLENNALQKMSWAGLNIMASHALGEGSDVLEYRRGGQSPNYTPDPERVPPGAVTLYAGGNVVPKDANGKTVLPPNSGFLVVDMGAAPKIPNFIQSRTRGQVVDPETGRRVHQTVAPETPQQKADVQAVRAQAAKDSAARMRWLKGEGRGGAGGNVIGD